MPTCPGIRDPALKASVETIRASLEAEARGNGKSFVSVGVSLDRVVGEGLRLLEEWGPFDEIVVGRGWMNSAAIRYMWHDFPGVAAVPQIVVIERRVEKDREIVVRDERIRVRKAGAPIIVSWASAAFGDQPETADGEQGEDQPSFDGP